MEEKTKLSQHLLADFFIDTTKPILTDSSMVDLSNAVKGTENKTLDDFYANWLKNIGTVSVNDSTNFGAIRTRNGVWYPVCIGGGKSAIEYPFTDPAIVTTEFTRNASEFIGIISELLKELEDEK